MMKITILQTHLISALAKANKVISSKPQLPILQSVLLEAKGNEVSITGTNTETTIVVKTSAKVDQEGGVCVPAKILTEFVATLPEEPIKIMEKEGALQILCDGYDAEIPALNKAEFPKTTEDKKGKYIELKKDDFISSMDSVLFAAATDEG